MDTQSEQARMEGAVSGGVGQDPGAHVVASSRPDVTWILITPRPAKDWPVWAGPGWQSARACCSHCAAAATSSLCYLSRQRPGERK